MTLMVKNEERIVVRCIEHALRVADAVCVSDTGSTDGTLDVLGSYLPSLRAEAERVPTKLVHAPWKDFGSNRTASMLATVAFCDELGWDRRRTYSLVLDADMLLRASDEFDKATLTEGAYLVRQATASLSYYNVRLMRLSDPWRCVGVTHEYWESTSSPTEGSGPSDSGPVSLRAVHIDDVGDGGCKEDKFERDERVLRAALETDPANTRYMFYLAQTLRDVGKTEEAVEWYKRRADAGQWRQEVWYSMYQLCKLYYKLRMMPEMELWGLKAHEYCGERAECLYALTRAFRIEAQYHKAWHYHELGRRVVSFRPSVDAEALFEEPAVYTRLFEYERTILAYYVLGPAKHGESLREIVRYMNAHGTSETTWSNMEFYVTRVPSVSARALNFPPMGEYIASSVSVIRTVADEATSCLLNVRYVNYRIRPDGSYDVRGANDGVAHDAVVPVRTRNFSVVCDANFREFGPLAEMKPGVPAPGPPVGAPQGLEDLRLYRDEDDEDGQIKWVAASCDYSRDGTIQQVRGTYDATRLELRSATSMSMEGASCKSCEKNWIPLSRAVLMGQVPPTAPTPSFIYEWHPFTIGACERGSCETGAMGAEPETLVTRSTQETPAFFERLRGSSSVVEYDGALYAIAHLVCHGGKRRYYHVVVRLRASLDATCAVEAYTMPFFFVENQIEYCLGLEARSGSLFAFVSQNDADPVVVEIELGALEFVAV